MTDWVKYTELIFRRDNKARELAEALKGLLFEVENYSAVAPFEHHFEAIDRLGKEHRSAVLEADAAKPT